MISQPGFTATEDLAAGGAAAVSGKPQRTERSN